ncbi:porin family protein [Prevotella bivia]|uniref:porin family protein n=1 Tax=Prevotella bivia TaxID=28125 RepID=UPI002889E350|nr:porin family protein [Prevotella bivia]
MKRYVLATLALLLVTFASAQSFKFGIKGGLNVTDMHFSSKVIDKSNRAGFFFGPTAKLSFPLIGLGIDASTLYDYQSAKVDDGTGDMLNVKQQQIAIPVNLRYSIGLGSVADIFFFAGPQWGINVGNKNFKWNSGSSYSLKKSDFSVNVGLGATFLSHLQVSANYNIVCGKSADVTLDTAIDNITKTKSHNNSWQIGVAYFF